MEIIDFLPKYPNINNYQEDKDLNPYTEDFYKALFKKKEFYELRLDGSETFSKEKGIQTKYQKTVSRFLSSNTLYDKLLIVHSMGLGKCVHPDTLINIENQNIKIETLWDNFKKENIILDDVGEWAFPLKNIFLDSFNTEKKIMEKKLVLKLYRQYVFEHIRKIHTDTETITTTKIHKLYTQNGWSNNIIKGDSILKFQNNKIYYETVCKVEEYFYQGWVYDLEIKDFHNYIANGFITHNTCSAVGAIEQIRTETKDFNGAIILAKGEGILDNFLSEVLNKCTRGQYYPDQYNSLTSGEKVRRVKKKTSFYSFNTFIKFAKEIAKYPDILIENIYSNKIIVIDEVHNLRPQTDRTDDSDENEYDMKDEKDEKSNDSVSLVIQKEHKNLFDKDPEKETYTQFHRFLHLVKNCKILLLSGTPMKDTVEEIADVANLFLDLKCQFETGDKFIEKYVNQNNNKEFKSKLKGYISFLKEPESKVIKNFLQSNIDCETELKYFQVNIHKMSEFQTTHYINAYNNDKKQKSIFIDSKEASLFVYPDGTYGRLGFLNNIEKITKGSVETYKLKDSFKQAIIKDCQTKDQLLKKISKYSTKYADALKKILTKKGNCFIYSSIVKGSGLILFSLLLELFGFSQAKGDETTPKLRYALLTSQNASSAELKTITSRFNKEDNWQGDYIKVIIGSRTVSEGFSFNNIIYENILTPHWNYSETSQAIARGIRLTSHDIIISKGIKPIIEISQSVAIPDIEFIKTREKISDLSIDIRLYKISEDKDIKIKKISRLLMETSFDCSLNYFQNISKNGKDGSRDCEYTICRYTCDGFNDNKEFAQNIKPSELDYSSFNTNYTNSFTSPIKQRIDRILRQVPKINYDSLVKILSERFTIEEISNCLSIIKDNSINNIITFNDYKKIYSRTNVEKIVNIIEELFRVNFKLSFQNIVDNLKNYTKFEILYSLNHIISNNILLKDKYGLPSYLKEYNDYYFLLNDLIGSADFFVDYYSKNRYIKKDRHINEIYNILIEENTPKILAELVDISKKQNIDKNIFKKTIQVFPKEIIQTFIESSIYAENKNINYNVKLRKLILNIYNTYYDFFDNTWINLYTSDDIPRCLKNNASSLDWEKCSDSFLSEYKNFKQQEIQKIYKNKYNLIGKYNPYEEKFCLQDITPDELEEQAETKIDNRKKSTGKNCVSFKRKELINFLKRLNNNEKGNITGKNPELCQMIEKRLKEEKLVINDKDCGVQSKKKKEENPENEDNQGGKSKKTPVILIKKLEPLSTGIPGQINEEYNKNKQKYNKQLAQLLKIYNEFTNNKLKKSIYKQKNIEIYEILVNSLLKGMVIVKTTENNSKIISHLAVVPTIKNEMVRQIFKTVNEKFNYPVEIPNIMQIDIKNKYTENGYLNESKGKDSDSIFLTYAEK